MQLLKKLKVNKNIDNTLNNESFLCKQKNTIYEDENFKKILKRYKASIKKILNEDRDVKKNYMGSKLLTYLKFYTLLFTFTEFLVRFHFLPLFIYFIEKSNNTNLDFSYYLNQVATNLMTDNLFVILGLSTITVFSISLINKIHYKLQKNKNKKEVLKEVLNEQLTLDDLKILEELAKKYGSSIVLSPHAYIAKEVLNERQIIENDNSLKEENQNYNEEQIHEYN